MAKNIRNQYIAPKYENIVNDIETKSKRLPFNLTDGFNIKDIELLDKYTLRNGEISDEGMSKIMEKVKFSPFLRYFFRHKYHYTISKEHMDKLIESTPATEIKFIQPMLYFCFDLSELDNGRELYNRTAKSKEIATFTFNKDNKDVLLEMIKIFGTLSSSHRKDIISIIDLILDWGEM